jgi:hypothetical protein
VLSVVLVKVGAMEETFVPFRGIKNDLNGRLMCYKEDWTGGLRAGFRYICLLPWEDCFIFVSYCNNYGLCN